MNLRDAQPAASGWQARLELGFSTPANGRTVLSHRRHTGPLVVQKPFYPEGEAVCHATVVHPPGGIAGGDRLELNIEAARGAHAVVTTPGAAKWYRSKGPVAQQIAELKAGDGAVLEWLPQPTIVYDGARVQQSLRVQLAEDARYIGWEILCFGRIARGERFTTGEYRARTEIVRGSQRLWNDAAVLSGGARVLQSHAGLGGMPVTGLLLAAGESIDAALIERCRQEAVSAPGRCGVTGLPGVLAVRFIGDSTEAAWRYFTALWRIVRPAIAGRVACPPRIWQT